MAASRQHLMSNGALSSSQADPRLRPMVAHSQLFMRNISFSSNQTDVVRAIAEIVHRKEYQLLSPIQINFEVHLHRGQRSNWSGGHNGKGTVTLPTDEIASRLLQEYGGETPFRRLIIGNRPVKLSASNRPPEASTLQKIRTAPYQDPVAVTKQQETAQFVQQAVARVRCIQFGWDCRDSAFSVEWQYSLQQSAAEFNSERRELRVSIGRAGSEQISFAMKIPQIAYAAIPARYHHEPSLQLSLSSAPSFEQGLMNSQLEPRRRLASLPLCDDRGNPHFKICAYSSLALRLVFNGEEDLRNFQRAAKKCNLGLTHADHPIKDNSIFSEGNLLAFETWMGQLPYPVAFQIESLLHSLILDVEEILSLKPHLTELLRRKGTDYMAGLLAHLHASIDYRYAPEEETLLGHVTREAKQYNTMRKREEASYADEDPNLFLCHHINVTPTTFELQGPFPERSNRVVRWYPRYHDHFLRISFVDEGHMKLRFEPREIDGKAFIRDHVGKTMREGLFIGGRKFEFLAWSQSALKEHTVYFVRPFLDGAGQLIDAQTIITRLGKFDGLPFDPKLIYCPARYAARLSQAFSATDASVSVEATNILIEDDILSDCGRYSFTDGHGSMSLQVAKQIHSQSHHRRKSRQVKLPPAAVQIRLQGAKGMFSVDHTLPGLTVVLRPSMIKFEAPNSKTIEVCRAFGRPGKYFLNRPLIMLLEGLGVSYETFERFQDLAVNEANSSLESLEASARLLETHGLGAAFRLPSVLLSLHKSSLPTSSNSFYRKSMNIAVHHVLRELKHKARIPIPAPAVTLVGVSDVHGYLQPGEIFVCVKPVDDKEWFMEGPIVVSRSPTIHPGDIQIAHAIGRPPADSPFAVEPLRNCVVFSTLGRRPLPSCLGGGDLDGDEYNLIPLRDFPDCQPTTYEPAEYNPAVKRMLRHPSTKQDVIDFFVEYINSDVLGIIATHWLNRADTRGIFDPDCMRLALLHSDAVDYPKSGTPVNLKEMPRPDKLRPDWSAPETISPSLDNSKYYVSQRAIGKLFRKIDLPLLEVKRRPPRRNRRQKSRPIELHEEMEDLDIQDDDDELQDCVEDQVFTYLHSIPSSSTDKEDILPIYYRYTSELQRICYAHTIFGSRGDMLSEEEAMIGSIIAKTSQPRHRKEVIAKLREQTEILVRSVRADLNGNDATLPLVSLRRSWVAWKIALDQSKEFGAQSFSWIAMGAIFEAIKAIEDRDEF